MRVALAVFVTLFVTAIGLAEPQGAAQTRLFAPEDLGVLEAPDRDEWQQPERVMDALNIADGARVADVGAGGGWFTVRLARRVGPNGRVFAEDIQKPMIDSIDRRVRAEGLSNVTLILGTPDNPNLPSGLHAALIVDTFPQVANPTSVLRHIAAALAPNGRLGIVEFKNDGAGGPGPPLADRVAASDVVRTAEAAGFTLHRHETFLRYQYLLVFVK